MLTSRSENGAVLVLFALAFVMLIGFMALAVDSAYAFAERRSSQSTADVAAVGGALQVIDHNGTQSQIVTDLVDKAMDLAASNLSGTLDWENCEDPEKFTENATDYFSIGDSQYTECISWESDFSEVRVKLPQRDIPTFFARVIGFDTVSIGAFAEVTQVVSGGGGVLPFGVLSGQGNGLLCLKTAGSFPSECATNAQGNFGMLDFTYHGNNPFIPPVNVCKSNTGTNGVLANIISTGIDHDLTEAPSTAPRDDQDIGNDITLVKEDQPCPGSSAVMAVKTATGDKGTIDEGLVYGTTSNPGRLTRSLDTDDFDDVPIDDVALWEYVISGTCGGDDPDTKEAMTACLSGPGILFEDEIMYSPRLAMVPELWQLDWPVGSKYVTIQGFKFVYLHTMYACQGPTTCATVFEPGTTNKTGSGAPKIITAFAIPDSALSDLVRASFGTPSPETYALTR
jgi:hypothetical protein